MELDSRFNVVAVDEVSRYGPEMISCFNGTERSLEEVVETLLILPENIDDLLLDLGSPVSRWMFSSPDLSFHLRPGL